MSVFGPHYSWGQPGCFLFKLTRTPFDTQSVRDGVYDLVVTVTDIRGNHSSTLRRHHPQPPRLARARAPISRSR